MRRSCQQLSVPTPSFPQEGIWICSQESKYLMSNLNVPSPGKATFPQALVPSTNCDTAASCCCASCPLYQDGKDNPWLRAMVEQDTGSDLSLAVGREVGLQHNLSLERRSHHGRNHGSAKPSLAGSKQALVGQEPPAALCWPRIIAGQRCLDCTQGMGRFSRGLWEPGCPSTARTLPRPLLPATAPHQPWLQSPALHPWSTSEGRLSRCQALRASPMNKAVQEILPFLFLYLLKYIQSSSICFSSHSSYGYRVTVVPPSLFVFFFFCF